MNDRLDTLRALLQQTPSEQVWDALCEELALWEHEALEKVALPYAREHLERWPDEVEMWADAGPLVTVRRAAGLGELEQLVQSGQQVRWLELRLGRVAERSVRGIVTSLQALRLHGLSLEVEEVGDGSGVSPLEELDAPRLRVLMIEAPGLGDASAQNIADNPRLSRLARLSIISSGLTSAGAKALAKAAHLSSLTALDISHNKLGDAGLRALLQSPHLTRLTTLMLASCGLGPKSAQVIAQSRAVAGLSSLELFGNRLTVAGQAALAASPHLSDAVKRALAG